MSRLIVFIFSTIIFSLVFISCDDKKDETGDKYPCIYIKEKMEYLPVALYSSKGVIYDRTKIEAFQEHLRAEYQKNHHSDGIITIAPPQYYVDFIFDNMIELCEHTIAAKCISKDSVDVMDFDLAFDTGYLYDGTQSKHEEGLYSSIKKHNGITYWESRDTSYSQKLLYNSGYYWVMSGSPPTRYSISSIFDSLSPYYHSTEKSEDIIGLFVFTDQKSCIYLIENKDEIYIPYYKFLYKKQTDLSTFQLNNIPLPDNQIISMLAAGDTLVLQQSRLHLSKYSR